MNISKQNSKTVVINTLNNSGKKEWPTLILVQVFGKDVEDVAIMGADAYHLACQLKGAQVFAISIKDLEFQAKKKARSEINPKTVVLEEYHDILDVFSKKNSDTLLSY